MLRVFRCVPVSHPVEALVQRCRPALHLVQAVVALEATVRLEDLELTSPQHLQSADSIHRMFESSVLLISTALSLHISAFRGACSVPAVVAAAFG